jgi:hypothetical protein
MSVALVPRLQNILKAIFPIVIFFYTTLQTGMTGISLQGAMASDFSFVCQFFSSGTIVFLLRIQLHVL